MAPQEWISGFLAAVFGRWRQAGGGGGGKPAALVPAPAAGGGKSRPPLEDPDFAAFYLLFSLLGLCLLWFLHMLFDRRATLWEFLKRIDLVVFTLPVAWYFFFRVPFSLLFETKEGVLELRTMVRDHLMPADDEGRQRRTLRALRQLLLVLLLGGWFLSALPTRFEMEYEQAMALTYSGQTEEAAAQVDSLWTTRRNLASYFLKEEALNQYERKLVELAHIAIRAEETDRAFLTDRADWQPLKEDLDGWRAAFGREYFHGQIVSALIQSSLRNPHAALLEVRQAVIRADTPLRRAEAAMFAARAYLGEGDLGLAEIQIARVLERSALEGDRPFAWSTLMHYFRRGVCRDPSYSLEGLSFEWRARNIYAIIQALGLNYASAESGWEGILRDGLPGAQRARVLSNLGELAVVKERWAEAESRLKEALREDARWLPAQLNLIEMCGLRRQYIQAQSKALAVSAQYAVGGPTENFAGAQKDSRQELVALHIIWLRLRMDAIKEGQSPLLELGYDSANPARLNGVIAEAKLLPALKPFTEALSQVPAEPAPRAAKKRPPQPAGAGRDDYARLLLGLARRYSEVSIGYGGDIVPREFAAAASHEAHSEEMQSEVRELLDRLPPAQVDNPRLVLAEADGLATVAP